MLPASSRRYIKRKERETITLPHEPGTDNTLPQDHKITAHTQSGSNNQFLWGLIKFVSFGSPELD